MISNKRHNRIVDHMIKNNKDKDIEIQVLKEYIDQLTSFTQEEIIEHQVKKIVASVANSGFVWYS